MMMGKVLKNIKEQGPPRLPDIESRPLDIEEVERKAYLKKGSQ